MDPIELLGRNDKWFLGCGDGILFAPPFPQWLDAPGFWDEATIYQYSCSPLFTVTWLDADGRELPVRALRRWWTPSELTVEYSLGRDIHAREVRSVHPRGVFASEWTVDCPEPIALHAVAWSVQDTRSNANGTRGDPGLGGLNFDSINGMESGAGVIGWSRRLFDRREVPLDVRMELSATIPASSWYVGLSERSATPAQPHWRFTPFLERWGSQGLPNRVATDGITQDGQVFPAVHCAFSTLKRHHAVGFAMRLSPADPALRHGRTTTPLSVRLAPESPADETTAEESDRGAVTSQSPLARVSRARWNTFMQGAPRLRCSDPYLERYYWYRWYGLFLNAIEPGVGNYKWPTTCEGIGFFHEPITYSAQCHARELRWHRDVSRARGVLSTIFAHQKADGGLHGRIYMNHLTGTDFYHANWGDAFEAIDLLHPDDTFLAEIYPALKRHAEWLVQTRDAEGSGMFDVIDQFETGQEYMARYQAVDPNADSYGWENRIRLKGIDVTVYAYALFSALARLALRTNAAADHARWTLLADRTAAAVRGKMWDPAEQMFFDVDPKRGARTKVAAAVCFYPYFTDLATEEHLVGLDRNLFNPARFWTPFPVPSSSVDDPTFSAVAEWKGKRHVCPWNGRVWPMTNSHIMEALGRWASPDRPMLRERAAGFLHRFVRMMFHDGDVMHPNCHEHYNPETGAASQYRGIDDYQHSWVVDLIIRFACGLHVMENTIVIDPLPMNMQWLSLNGVFIDGRELSIQLKGDVVTATRDGVTSQGRVGEALILER